MEKANFLPFAVSTTGGIAPEATSFLKRLAQKLSSKLNQSYPIIMGYLRRKLRFELLRTTLMAVRGFRKNKTFQISDLNLNLIKYYVPQILKLNATIHFATVCKNIFYTTLHFFVHGFAVFFVTFFQITKAIS